MMGIQNHPFINAFIKGFIVTKPTAVDIGQSDFVTWLICIPTTSKQFYQ